MRELIWFSVGGTIPQPKVEGKCGCDDDDAKWPRVYVQAVDYNEAVSKFRIRFPEAVDISVQPVKNPPIFWEER